MPSTSRIYVTSTSPNPLLAIVIEQFRSHFGSERVHTIKSRVAMCEPGDLLVVLLTAEDGADGVARAKSFSLDGGLANWIETAIHRKIPVLPVLLTGAKMPPPDALPEEIRDFAHAQWQVLGDGEHFQNDFGVLVSHMEVHLPDRPGEFAAYDNWLFLAGIPLAVVGGIYTSLWFCETFWWPYGMERVEQLTVLRRSLTLSGCWPFGCGLLLCTAGCWWRNIRNDARLRANSLRHGVNTQLRPRDDLAYASMGFGLATWGFGAVALVPAILLGLASQISYWRTGTGRPQMAFAAMLIAVLASLAWLGVALRMAAVARALPYLADGVKLLQAASTTAEMEAAEALLRAAEREAPCLPQPSHAVAFSRYRQATGLSAPLSGRGLFGSFSIGSSEYSNDGLNSTAAPGIDASDRSRLLEEALHEINRALNRYPSRGRGLVGPDGDSAASAYELRSAIYTVTQRPKEAKRDQATADRVSPWLEIFGGLLRWWEY